MAAGAYCGSSKVTLPRLAAGHHLVTAVKSSTVAYEPATVHGRRGRDRPGQNGHKLKLCCLFDEAAAFLSDPSPVYGDHDVTALQQVSMPHPDGGHRPRPSPDPRRVPTATGLGCVRLLVQRQLKIPSTTIKITHSRRLELGLKNASPRSPGGREGRSPPWGI
jgi:hypothetical protein